MPKPEPLSPAEIAAQLAPLVQADLSTTMVILAGTLTAIREAPGGVLGAGVKPGADALRVELEKWRLAYLEAKKAGQDGDALAAARALGAQIVTPGTT